MVENPDDFSIGMVERDTGIGRDTLRIWERRYGFPEPQRNDKGERIYPEKQVRRLQRIRRLLDQGLRPGKLLALNEQDLDNLEADLYARASDPAQRQRSPTSRGNSPGGYLPIGYVAAAAI